MDRALLADFLRARREAVQPEDVGLPRGPRRRTGGLRREEVAALCGMSADYYSRIEQQRGPNPSAQILASIAVGLRLPLEERDHLFRLAGHTTPRRLPGGDQVNPGMRRIFDRLSGSPAQVVSHLGETLAQTPLAVALLGDDSGHTGLARSLHYRWFTDPAARLIDPDDEHAARSRMIVAHLRDALTRDGQGSRAAAIVAALLPRSAEFAELWRQHPVLGPYCAPKRIRHPRLGEVELHCQTLVDPDQSQALLVFTAAAGSASQHKLDQLSALAAARPG
jgi:transcriptional regulator with XRE-family HTH domain